MNTFLFFDLEQTLIPDWFEDRSLLTQMHPSLKQWILNQAPFTAGLLSWAVSNKDLPVFNKDIRPFIEKDLDFAFDDKWIITTDVINAWMNNWKKTPFNRWHDNQSNYNKFDMMFNIWKHLFTEPDTRVILLDDTVEDMVIHRSSLVNNSMGTLTSIHPVCHNVLEFVNPWTLIHE